MPVGIENLATGFLQGLNARKQQKRQDVIDQREAERFDMQKQQFADQQAANQLSLKTNQFNLTQAQAKAEREKILQEKEDNFRKQWEGFARPFAMGNDQEGYNALEKTYNDLGYMGKGAFKRDAQGNVLLDDKGNITFLTYGADGKPTSKSLNKDQMIEGFINSYNPLKHWEHEQKIAEEIAKENREFKQKKELVGLNAANAERLARLQKGLTPARKQVIQDENGNYVIVNAETGVGEVVTVKGKPLVGKIKGQPSEKDYEPYLPLAQQFFGNIKPNELKDIVKKQTKSQFISNALTTFNTKNVGKYVSSKDRLQTEQTINALADSLYPNQDAVSLDNPQQVISRLGTALPAPKGLNAVQPQNSPVDLLRGKNIVTEQDAADAIRELRAKKFTDEQINAAFDELGL